QVHDLSNIDLKEYLEDLTEIIMQSYGEIGGNITYKLDLQKQIIISIDSAVPLGLIVNELIANIFKHAFPNRHEGVISIRLYADKDQSISIELSDNGVGFPQGFDPRKDASIGLSTIFSIAENQLGGEISVKSNNGVSWCIKIKDNLYKARV
ncbi:MAG: sensor histidine kinase, partial [Fidelibacterota bacterium]